MHKLFTRFLAVAALLMSTANLASAVQWPTPACPDSTGMIFRIQSGIFNTPVPGPGPCDPAVNDTVSGVGGIIIGFDPVATGFDAYLQNTGAGPFSGIDFFTGSVNPQAAPFNWALGDSIIVEYGKVLEFGGATEILAPNNVTASPNWIARKVSSGNPLPAFFVGTTTQLRETPTNTTAELYEGCLVRINGPMTVARNSLTGGLGTNAFLLINASNPADSVFIDGNKLIVGGFAPPAVGTVIQSVQGVMNQTSRGYRIMLRNSGDIVAATPPNLADAYPLTSTKIRARFDRDVTAGSAGNAANYSLASFGSIDAVTVVGSDAVEIDITNGLSSGDLETLTANGVVSTSSGLAMTTPQSRSFVNGVLTAAQVQQANADSLNASPCLDRSRFAGGGGQITQGGLGTRVSVSANIVARYNNLYYAVDPGNGLRGGVAIFAPPAPLTIGQNYRVVGQIQEFFGETEVSQIIAADPIAGAAAISPQIAFISDVRVDTCDVLSSLLDGEDFEGRLVRIQGAKVVQRFPTLPTNGFHIADLTSPDTMFVQNFNSVLNPFVAPALGTVVSVTGHVHYEGGSFRIVPRDNNDISTTAGVGDNGRGIAFSVYPNPARTARLSFSLPKEQDVEIGIYDVAGRQVVSLANGRMAAGTHSTEWSGRDASGNQVGAGVYFARMKSGGETRAIRTVYLGR